ncbi:MAG: orotate phosphoribosyltransferase [Gemmatimonadales bacterium]
MSNTETLKQLLVERSVQKGNFVLASGKSSTFYVDARLTTMSPEGMVTIGDLALEKFDAMKWKPESIGGLTLGADPVAFAISYASANRSPPLRAFTVRKEAKKHGTGNLIEGPFRSGDRVVVVEDVITTGKSAIQAIDAVEDAGGVIVGILAVVDREDGGREAIKARGYDVVSLTSISELLV